MQPQASERPLGELFGDLARDTAVLLKQELELAKVETVAKARHAGRSLGLVAVGIAVGLVGVLALAAAAITAMALVAPIWLACLVVGAALSAVAAVVVGLGVGALRRLDPLPRHAIETLKEDRQWLSEQISR